MSGRRIDEPVAASRRAGIVRLARQPMPPSLAMFTAADAGGGLEPTEGLGYAAQYPEERTLRRAPDRSHGGCQRLWRLGLHDTHANADVRDHAADDQRCVLRRLGDYR